MKNPNAKIAVITRTRNRALVLPRAADSIRSQQIDDLVWVVVNDGGEKDHVDRAVDDFNQSRHGQAIAIHNSTSVGMEAASNIGIKACTSEYIVIHDDDDSWNPGFLSRCLNFLDKHAEYEGVVTHSMAVHEAIKGEKIQRKKELPFNPQLESVDLSLLCIHNQYPPISFMFSRSACAKLGGFNEAMKVLGDWDFNLRFLLEFDIGLIPECLANHHIRSTLAESDNAYGNSVVADAEEHLNVESQYRHARFREDLQKGQVGLGHLLMTGKQIHLLKKELDGLKIAGDGWRKIQKIARKFGLF